MSKESNNSEHSRVKVNKGLVGLMALTMMATGCAPVIGATPTKEEEPTNSSSVGNIGPEEKEDSINAPIYELPRRVPGAGEERFFPPVNTPEPTATATEIPLIQGDIFFDPQSKEDFKNVALAPSPIDEPEKFDFWREEYLKLVNEKLINYSGLFLTTENMLINYNYNELILRSGDWPVVASYIFDYQGEKILTKTFVFKDGNTNLLVPLSATYPPEKSIYFQLGDYKTNRAGVVERMSLAYDHGEYLRDLFKKNSIKEPFLEAFFGDFISGEEYDAFARVLFGEANKEDLESFSKQPFILKNIVVEKP